MTAIRHRATALLLAVACAFAAPATLAAEPSDAQVDRLIETMDMRRMIDDMFTQIDAMSLQMGEQFLDENATAEQREEMRQVIAKQQAATRKAMSWDALGPIYRKVYRKLFTAEEVDAMIAFYGSEAGRGILRKMPQAMELTMQEMQPMLHALVEDMKREIEAAAHKH